MKKKKVFSKVLAIVLVLSLMLTTFSSFSAFAQETSSKEQLTEKGDLWQPESNSNALNFEGDLSIEELQSAKLNDEDTPEIVGQDNIEEKGHVNRLWEQEEDLNSIVFQNRDGTKTMYYYNYPVKYKDANGKIKDKSNKISQTSSGDYTNAENDINTYFPKKLNRNKGIELKFGEYVVEMAPDIKGNSGASRQTGHNKYFDPTEYVQYPNVFDESISLRYTPTFEGYKEDIVLSKYAGINEFSFRLYTDGLSLVMNEEGAYYLIDPLSGEIKTQIGDLVVYDSKPFDVPDEILNESVSNPTEEDYAKKEALLKEAEKNIVKESSGTPKMYSHQYKVETVKQDNEYLITIVVDEDYLTDSERVYPVYVDPTINVSVSGSGTGKTIQDVPIYSNRPTISYGGSGNNYAVVGYQGSNGIGRTLMKFPGLASNSTYAGLDAIQITNLSLHIYEGSGLSNTACIDLWQYTGTNWTENTARCNNVGWDSYTNNFTWNYINSSGWQTFNLTNMVTKWKNGGTGVGSPLDKGIVIKNYTSEYNSSYRKDFMTTESGSKPYLTFTYDVMPTNVTLSQSSKTLYIEDSFNLYATVSPSNSSQIVYWDSSDDEVATITSGGLVCAKSVGTTTITARSKLNSSVYGTCIVTVVGDWPNASKPTINDRSDWGARSPITNRFVSRSREPERIVFHHSAEKFSSTNRGDAIEEIQRIQNLHMDDEGKCDIAYHFIIDPAGRIWQGAVIDDYQRGHATGYYDDIGVLLLGDFQSRWQNAWNPDELNSEQKEAMKKISKWLCYKYNLSSVNSGQNAAPINTHRGVNPGDTVCPGENAAPWIENELREYINDWNS